MPQYNVATGIVIIPVQAENPRQAIAELKHRIRERGVNHDRHDEEISMSLVRSLDAGTLNFVVMDEHRRQRLCGELNGEYQEPVSPELAALLPNAGHH